MTAFTDALAEHRARFLGQLAARTEAMRALLQDMDPARPQAGKLDALQRQVHSLIGSAGTFGLHAVARAARELGGRLAQLPATGAPDSLWLDLEAALERLEDTVTAGLRAPPEALSGSGPSRSVQGAPLIHLVEDEPDQAAAAEHALRQAGYRTRTFHRLDEFRAHLTAASEPPAAVLMDMVFQEGDTAGADLVAELGLGKTRGIPVIFCSARDDLPARLAAYRAGGCRYLVKPLDGPRLTGLLDEITGRMPPEPFRVLLVDADPLLLDAHATVLRLAGMSVRETTAAMDTLRILEAFDPDVLLLGMRMPEASGPELAAIIREQDRHGQLPILFLSTASDTLERLRAFSLGGDDILEAPLRPEQLAAVVAARARRSRRHRETTHSLELTLYEREREHQALDRHALVSITDAQGRITYANDNFCRVSGYAREELLGQNHRLVKSGLHPPEFYAAMWHALTTGQIWQGEIRNRAKDGSLYWVAATITPFLDGEGMPYQYVSIRTDITALKASQEALRTSEERLRRGQAYANVGTWDWNIRTGELYWSERIGPLFGYPEGVLETSYENFLKAIHPDDRELVSASVNASVRHGIPYEIEHRVVWPDGSVRWLLERGAVARDPASGEAVQMLGVVQDIHERKQAELALVDSQRRLREAQILARMGDWHADLDSGALHWSPEIYRIFGRDPADFTPSVDAFLAAVHPDDRPLLEASHRRAAETGIHDVIHRIVRPDGGIRYVHELARAEFDQTGHQTGLTGTVQDVTERMEAEARLRESEERFSFAVEGAGDGIWDWNIGTGEMPLSGHYEAMLGYAKGELTPTIAGWVDSVHPDDLPRARQILDDYLAGRLPTYAIELRLRHKNGGYRWILCRGTVVARDAAGRPRRMIGIHSDITERKEAEERLTLFRRIFEASGQCVAITDQAGRLIYQNLAHAQTLGYDDDELLGRDFTTLLPPDVADAVAQQVRQASAEGHDWAALIPIRRKNGQVFMSASHVGFVKDAQGRTQNIFNIFTDFSEELSRRAELANAKEAAERANQAKSDFLSSMSHELRTPMNAIMGFAQMLEYDSQLSPDQQDNVEEILKAGRHLLTLINEVLDLAKIEAGRIDLSLEPVDVAPLVEDCRQLIQPLATSKGVALCFAELRGLVVRADRVRLKQVLLNLLSNAVKYNRPAGQVRLARLPGPTDRVRLAVADDGPGIPPERLGELFQPFNRLEAEGGQEEGTGIGLTITRRLVELMGGEIGVDSRPGEGACFWFELPEAQGNDLAEAAEDRPHALDGAAEPPSSLVLCIDDNPTNLKLISQILGRRRDLRLLTAHTPELGLELALAHRPDLILLDINMPGMNGYQVLEVIKADPRLGAIPVLAVTANAMPRDMERGLAAGFAAYLTKPLDLPVFLQTVDRHLPAPHRDGPRP